MRTNVRSRGRGSAAELVHGAVQIVHHEPHVSVEVPIQADRDDILHAAGDAVGRRGWIAGREDRSDRRDFGGRRFTSRPKRYS